MAKSINNIKIDSSIYDIHDKRIIAIDDYPIINSNNIVKSGGIAEKLQELSNQISYIDFIEFQHKDLSLYDIHGYNAISRTTANTYVVRNPGHYVIPLIYGNAIKNNQINDRAYTNNGSQYSADFVNYLGNQIVSPYIETDTGVNASTAELVWQTSKDMITNVSILQGADCNYLRFTVNNIPSVNGDAVLAIKDENGNIMWSWMIWAVSEDIKTATIVNNTGVEYIMMTAGLGAIFDLNKTNYVVPHFQWGRKDPMCPPASYNSTSNMVLYDINGDVYNGFGILGVADDSLNEKTVKNSIRYPNLFFTEYDSTKYNWNNLDWFVNFWNANMVVSSSIADDQDIAIKTIYDPCPRGFMIPSGRFATGFTSTGSNTSTAAEFNIIGSWNNGWTFKKNSNDTGGLYLPVAGYRNSSSGSLNSVGSYGYWWSYAPNSQTSSRSLGFYSSGVYPLDNNYHALGFAVLPAQEFE